MKKTNAIGLFVKKGRYGGTYAHKDIAFEFASAISSVFKLYLIKRYYKGELARKNSFENRVLSEEPKFVQKRREQVHSEDVSTFLD